MLNLDYPPETPVQNQLSEGPLSSVDFPTAGGSLAGQFLSTYDPNQQEEPAVIDQQQEEPAVIEQQEEPAVIEQQEESAVLDQQQEESAVIDQQHQESAVIDEDFEQGKTHAHVPLSIALSLLAPMPIARKRLADSDADEATAAKRACVPTHEVAFDMEEHFTRGVFDFDANILMSQDQITEAFDLECKLRLLLPLHILIHISS